MSNPVLREVADAIAAKVAHEKLNVYTWPTERLELPALSVFADLPHMSAFDNEEGRTFCAAPRLLRWGGIIFFPLKNDEDTYELLVDWAQAVADVFEQDLRSSLNAELTEIDGPSRTESDSAAQAWVVEFSFTTWRD